MNKNRALNFLFFYILLGSLLYVVFLFLAYHHFFETWKSLGNPITNPGSGEKVDRILAVGYLNLRVGTTNHNEYEVKFSWNPYTQTYYLIPGWQSVPYLDTYAGPISPPFDCPFTFWVPPIFRVVVVQTDVESCREEQGTEYAKYAIDSSGTVWMWQQSVIVNEEGRIFNAWYVQAVLLLWLIGGPFCLILADGYHRLIRSWSYS